MSLCHCLTVFHDPSDCSKLLVSARESEDARRNLHRVSRAAPRIVRKNLATGQRDDCPEWSGRYLPAHGQVVNGHAHFQLPPEWRYSLPPELALPTGIMPWMSSYLFFVWGAMGVSALCQLSDPSSLQVFWTWQEAIHALTESVDVDILFVCTSEAADLLEKERLRRGWLEFARSLPVVCIPDQFARTVSLDRAVDGSASWYRPPFQFAPDEACGLSEYRRDEMACSLVEHRRQWLLERHMLEMMLSLSAFTRLPLHEVAMAHQTTLADALVESIWMQAPLELDAPTPATEAPTDEERRTFKGANVLSAELGLHCCKIMSPDVHALYPNVVLEYMSETHPLMARLFQTMIEERSRQTNPINAFCMKLLANVRYGTLKHGRYRDIALAELITEAGRRVQTESLAALANSDLVGLRVLGGDTDCLVIGLENFCNPELIRPHLLRVLNGGRRHALYKSEVDCFSCMFIVNNKCWAAVQAGTADVIVTRGLAQNRSVTPRFLLPSHREWIRLVLLDVGFQQSASRRLEWIKRRAAELRVTQWPVSELVIWPKPTQKHPRTDRGYVVLKWSRQHVAYSDYMNAGVSHLPIDVDYLITLYFEDDLMRQTKLLGD